jgi:cell division protein FtsW
MIASGMFFIAGGNLKQILPVAVFTVLALTLAIITSPYRLKRIKTFFNPEIDPLGASFQVRQITLALGSGGWFGQGLGNSQQKYAYIPEASSDSIFAIVAEEIGFVGSLIILGLYAIYFYSIFQISQHLPEGSFAQLFSTGLLLWIAGQTLLNLAAIVVLVPLTGLPLPFFSYGGSSLVSMLLANGILVKSWRSQK